MDDAGVRRIGEDPFSLPRSQRDAVRRLRGRLAAPVTVWTATSSDGRPVGITVSSVLIAEGAPPVVLGLIGTLSDFWDAVQETRRFVVHVLGQNHRRLADEFAGRYTQVNFSVGWAQSVGSPWGPVLQDVTTRAYCQLGGFMESGYFLLVRGDIDRTEIDDAAPAPLVHYRGGYATLRARKNE